MKEGVAVGAAAATTATSRTNRKFITSKAQEERLIYVECSSQFAKLNGRTDGRTKETNGQFVKVFSRLRKL